MTRSKNGWLSRMDVDVLVIIDQNATTAHAALARLDPETGELVKEDATGSAKREPGDPRDDNIATNLAVGRALVNLGLVLQDTGRMQVELSMLSRDASRKLTVARKLLRGIKPAQAKLLPIPEILDKYGPQAAAVAVLRRGEDDQPHGRHARHEQKG